MSVSLLACACVGDIVAAPPQPAPVEVACGQPPRLARRTGADYRSAVARLAPRWASLGSSAVPFAQPRRTDLYSSWSSQASLDAFDVADAWAAADAVATEWAADAGELCPSPSRTPECMRRVWGPVLELLWSRRPTDDELAEHSRSLTDGETELPGPVAATASLRAALMGPDFLFRSELGVEGQLPSHEVAAALSYSLWNQPPDATLRERVADDALTTSDQVEGQALRLLERPAEVPALRRFLHELLAYPHATDVAKDPVAYPFHRPAALVDDTEKVVDRLVADHARSGLLRALLLSDVIYVRPETAKSWGVTLTTDAGTYLTSPERTGVLTHPAWLVAMSQSDHNHLVRRGRFIRERLLCGTVPNLPGGVVPQIENTPGLTLRERLAQHSSDPACSGCHSQMDPLGDGFEAWDHLGRPRTTDNGAAIVTDGRIDGAGDADGPYADTRELMTRLSGSRVVKACWVKQLFRSVLGREATVRDRCELERLTALYDTSGEDTVAVIAALFASTDFLHRQEP